MTPKGTIGRRRASAALALYCAAGLVVAGAITVYEAAHPPLIRVVGKVATHRVGLVTTATARVETRSTQAQCPVIHLVAEDTNSNRLAEATAAPVSSAPLTAGRPETYRASLTLSRLDYREKLKTFAMFVYEPRTCPNQGPGA